jgi:hypothetical protein
MGKILFVLSAFFFLFNLETNPIAFAAEASNHVAEAAPNHAEAEGEAPDLHNKEAPVAMLNKKHKKHKANSAPSTDTGSAPVNASQH